MVDSTDPINPPPVTRWREQYLPICPTACWGFVFGHIPQLHGVAMVNGFEGVDPPAGVEAFARAPHPYRAFRESHNLIAIVLCGVSATALFTGRFGLGWLGLVRDCRSQKHRKARAAPGPSGG